jgi:glycosyltransferase involved in cell wall biosynthesis
VDSVVAQTLSPAEVILVDDGSRDGTLECLEALVAAHRPGWIRIVALPTNQGAASARNAGWAVATQPLIAFLDADDAWHPRKIELQYGYMSTHPEVALCGHGHERLDTSEIPHRTIPSLSAEPISKWSLLLSNRFLAPTVVMIRREVPYRFLPDRRHVDDHLLWLQLVYHGFTFVRLSAKLAFTYKAPYGDSGLSSQLWKMEKAELENYWILYGDGCIGRGSAIGISAYSLAKFVRRLILVCIWRVKRAAHLRA